MIYLAAAFLPLPYACAAGAIGDGLADLLTAPVWAPATIIIKMLICLPFSSKGTKLVTKRNVVALFLAFAISATGYYIAEGIMFGFTVSFFTSVSGSIVQSGGSAPPTMPALPHAVPDRIESHFVQSNIQAPLLE
mgnify:CR=1 FL=1